MGYNWNIQSLSKRLPLYVILIRLSKAIHAQALSTTETVTINQESRASDLGFGVLLRVLFITLYATWRRMPVKRISDSEEIGSPTPRNIDSPFTGSRRAARVSFLRRMTWAQTLGRNRQRGWRSSRMQTRSLPARWGPRRFCDPAMWRIMWIEGLSVNAIKFIGREDSPQSPVIYDESGSRWWHSDFREPLAMKTPSANIYTICYEDSS